MGLDLPPLPIAATLEFATGIWSVTFDKALQSGALNAANWDFIATDIDFTGLTAVAAGSVVSGTSAAGLGDIGPDAANYAAAPADVLSLTGLPAAAFVDFPLTVT